MLVITGEGLKTLDAVRGTFAMHTIEPDIDAFQTGVEEATSEIASAPAGAW